MLTKKKTLFIALPLTLIALCVGYVGIFGLSSLANPGPKLPGQTIAEADLEVETFADGLESPWGMAFLPDGRMLVTEKPGRLRIVSKSGKVSKPIKGVPEVYADGQGGLLDVALDPNFKKNSRIYLSFAELDEANAEKNSTAVLRAELKGKSLRNTVVIWRQEIKTESFGHFGSRLVFDRDGYLYVTTGERYFAMKDAQKIDNTHGKIVRITTDGAPAPGNPFLGNDLGLDEIYSYGHRNVQGAALHPETGILWAHEHGPRGGDELNLITAGRNYGWPVITYGIDYDMTKISDLTQKSGMQQPVHYWVPSIAPSGMIFYTGDRYEGWKGSVLIGSLMHMRLVRLELEGNDVVRETQMLSDIEERIRDVEQGPNGYVYLLTDNEEGRVLKLVPKR